MEAEENGGFAAIWPDMDGFIAEGPNMNVACKAGKGGKLPGIKVGNVSAEEGKKAIEMMLIGSGILVWPVVQWDEQVIGDSKAFSAILSTLKFSNF
ncbi:hypothetical protein RJ641_022320 [Dillenia turbinata]|uniref:Uncharacterized protein n=1 Tax=Dillenia turbinata TaxID=194707 RepID=A0AAN8YRK7_9MAGN